MLHNYKYELLKALETFHSFEENIRSSNFSKDTILQISELVEVELNGNELSCVFDTDWEMIEFVRMCWADIYYYVFPTGIKIDLDDVDLGVFTSYRDAYSALSMVDHDAFILKRYGWFLDVGFPNIL